MQFESNCADDIETSYIESHYVLPVAADAASPVVEDTSSAAIDGLPAVDFQSPSNEFAVFCASLRSGLPFPSDLSANDVVDGVLNAFDVEIFPLRLDKRVWAFQCAKSEYEHVARKEIVVKQYHVCFHSNMEEVAEPQLAHVWYKSCNGQDVPSTVTAARIIGTVKNATNIDLVPVPDSDDALEPDIVPRAAFEFLCQPKEVRKLQEPATARIVVKRCELQLLVGEDENNTSDPPSALAPCGIDGGMEHADLPPPPAVPPSGPPATPVLVPEPVLAPVADPVAAVAAREAQLFDSLRGSYGVLTTRLSPSCDAGLGELTLHVLYLHFSYEYRYDKCADFSHFNILHTDSMHTIFYNDKSF